MKVNLVVTAAGPNQGRSISIPGATFLIGRDPHCNLRPASQAVSKQHCAIHIRNGQVILEDFGSTNGSLVNGVAVEGERVLNDGDELKIGPMEFKVQVVPVPTPMDGTPLPNKLKPLAADGTKPPSSVTVQKPAQPTGKSSMTLKPVPPAAKSTPAQKPAPAPTASTTSEPPKPAPVPIKPASDGDDAAAMLLGMDDVPSGEEPVVPEGSTVMEIPTIDASGRLVQPAKPAEKKPESAESSSAASELLKRYFRRTS